MGKPLAQWSVAAEFARLLSDELNAHHETVWQRQIEIEAGATILLLRGSPLPAASGFVVVFDDITQLIAAQRATAWGEVARRLAHEIKNPLTPMKLSIQYLQKAIDSNSPNVKTMTTNVASTLVEQIDHLSKIASDFSQFQRSRQRKLLQVSVAPLAKEK